MIHVQSLVPPAGGQELGSCDAAKRCSATDESSGDVAQPAGTGKRLMRFFDAYGGITEAVGSGALTPASSVTGHAHLHQQQQHLDSRGEFEFRRY